MDKVGQSAGSPCLLSTPCKHSEVKDGFLHSSGPSFNNKYAFIKIKPTAFQETTDVQEADQSKPVNDRNTRQGNKVFNLGWRVVLLRQLFDKLGNTHGLALMDHRKVNSFITDACDSIIDFSVD